MELFDNIPDDWKTTSHSNIKKLFGDMMFKQLKTYGVLGKVVQHGVKVNNVNKHAFSIGFQYKAQNDSADSSIVGKELDFIFIVNKNKTKFKLNVIKYQIRVNDSYGTYIRVFLQEQSINSMPHHVTIEGIIRYVRRICIYYEKRNYIDLYDALI